MKVIKPLSIILMVSACMATQAATPSAGEAKTFNCMDKTTFSVNSECMSQKIESNLVYKQAQKVVMENVVMSNDRAIATITFDEKTMTINVLAHKDATIAKVDARAKK